MAGIDDKVVSVSLDASKFESGVNKVIHAMEQLKKSLDVKNAGKGLDEVSSAAKRIDLSHIASGVDGIKGKLSALSVAALAVFANIATQAVSAGARIVKAFTIGPAIAGFQEYSTNLNSIQTILANTEVSGANLNDVNRALQDLNRYSDKTIYNFSQMARNIGTFTAAGVDLKTSTASIKGIANLAALSGSNADQASTAMYQLSQAIAAGSVKLQDWNSVVNAGMGGTVFQRALATTAVKMGTLKDGSVKLSGAMKNVSINGEAFRNSLSTPGKASWLTSKVLTNTLKQFTGDLSDAALAAQGFNKAEIKAIQQTAKTAQAAATQVKTISQVFDVAKETAGSGWAQTFQIIFGNFKEAKTTFTALSNTINGFINTNARARNKVLADWKALGGRTVLIEGIKTAFEALGQIIKPIKDAFRDIFPAATGKSLLNLSNNFQILMERMKPSVGTVLKLKSTFKGVFALLDIGKQVLKGIATMFKSFFSAIGTGNGGFLKFTGSVGDWIVKIDQALKKGDKLQNFFSKLGTILAAPIKFLLKLKDAFANLFSGDGSGGFSKTIDGMSKSLSFFHNVVGTVSTVFHNLMANLGKFGDILAPEIDKVAQSIKDLGPAIKDAASQMSFEPILSVIKTGLFAGLVLMIKKFLGKGSFLEQISKGTGGIFQKLGGMVDKISGVFDSLRGSLVALQQNIKSKTLKNIAESVGLLAASVVALSLVDPKKLNSALSAMTIGFGELLGAMKILTIITKTPGFVKLPSIAFGLGLLAGAIDILSAAVVVLSFLSWESLLKGLAGVGGLLGGLVLATKPLSAASKGMISAGFGITALAIGLNILAFAVKQFGGMKWSEMGKGLVGVGGGLVAIGVGLDFMPAGRMVAMGAGLVAVGFGLKLIAGAVQKFSGMSWKAIGKGFVGVGGGLFIIAVAMEAMPNNMPLLAAGLVAVGWALGTITDVVIKMSKMGWKEIGKGLAGLGGALVVVAFGLAAMSEEEAGALSLVVAAFGIKMLASAMQKMGGQSWGEILKGLFLLAATLAVIGAAAIVLTPALPSMFALGAALIVIGTGLTLVGAGVFLIGTGLSALALGISALVKTIVDALVTLVKAIPEIVSNIVTGLTQLGGAVATATPAIVAALTQMIESFVNILIQVAPVVAKAFLTVIQAILSTIWNNRGAIIQGGLDILVSLVKGILSGVGQLVAAMLTLIGKVLSSVVSSLGRIVVAGASLLMALVRGILSKIGQMTTSAATAVARFVTGILSGVGKLVTAGANLLLSVIRGIVSKIGQMATTAVTAIGRFISGLVSAGGRLPGVGTSTMGKFITAMANKSLDLVRTGAQAIAHFMAGLMAAAIGAAASAASAGFNIGKSLVQGVLNGLESLAGQVASKAADIGKAAIHGLGSMVGFGSPATEFIPIGASIVQGFILGIDDNAKDAHKSASAMGLGVINAVKTIFGIASPSKIMIELGKEVSKGFAVGIMGSTDDINSAFDSMNQKLASAMEDSRKIIASEQDKLKKLLAATKPDAKAIKEAQDTIKLNQDILAKSTAAHKALTHELTGMKGIMIGMANDYQKVADKLKAANDALAEARKTRDDAIKGFSDQYSTLPDIVTKDAEGNSIDQLATYEDSLKHQADAVAAYQSTLDQLRALGLDDATYQKLLAEGTQDQAFADQLLAGGKTAVEGLNKLDAQLKTNANVLAKHAGHDLYDAGVEAAKGIVKGLQSQKSALYKAMLELARTMVKALKDELGIKSPSQVFADLGRYSMEGFAKGFTGSSKMLTDAVDVAGKDALSAMEKSMRDISDVVTESLDTNPVITPILDLTQIRGQAAELSTLTNVSPITAAASYGQAATISSLQLTAQSDLIAASAGGTSVKFEQNNYSPESLSEIEIYRQTKNQLSQLKSALALN